MVKEVLQGPNCLQRTGAKALWFYCPKTACRALVALCDPYNQVGADHADCFHSCMLSPGKGLPWGWTTLPLGCRAASTSVPQSSVAVTSYQPGINHFSHRPKVIRELENGHFFFWCRLWRAVICNIFAQHWVWQWEITGYMWNWFPEAVEAPRFSNVFTSIAALNWIVQQLLFAAAGNSVHTQPAPTRHQLGALRTPPQVLVEEKPGNHGWGCLNRWAGTENHRQTGTEGAHSPVCLNRVTWGDEGTFTLGGSSKIVGLCPFKHWGAGEWAASEDHKSVVAEVAISPIDF